MTVFSFSFVSFVLSPNAMSKQFSFFPLSSVSFSSSSSSSSSSCSCSSSTSSSSSSSSSCSRFFGGYLCGGGRDHDRKHQHRRPHAALPRAPCATVQQPGGVEISGLNLETRQRCVSTFSLQNPAFKGWPLPCTLTGISRTFFGVLAYCLDRFLLAISFVFEALSCAGRNSSPSRSFLATCQTKKQTTQRLPCVAPPAAAMLRRLSKRQRSDPRVAPASGARRPRSGRPISGWGMIRKQKQNLGRGRKTSQMKA